MLFTGSLLALKRNFYTQTGNYGFTMDATVDNTSGIYHFGLSGDAGVLDFKLESGKIYWGDQFIQTYRSYEEFSVEAQFTSGTTNILKNDDPLIYGGNKSTGNFNYFYFTRADANMGGEVNVRISGDSSPNYSISTQGYLISTGQNAVTGYYANLSQYPIKIFDSSFQASALYNFGKPNGNIAANSSGVFAFSGDYTSIDFSQPILTNFATNFGNQSVLFSIIDVTTLNRFVQYIAPTNFSFDSSNVLNRDISWLNYSGDFVVGNYDASVAIQFTYSSGSENFTNIWNVFTGINSNSLVRLSASTGLFSGSGNFPANSSINFQINYSGVSGNAGQLLLTGNEILNPISQLIAF